MDLEELVSNSGEDISHYPEVEGFKLQENFFTYFTHSTKLVVLTATESLSFTVAHSLLVNGVLQSMTKSTLYQLRNRHPACDGIGLLQESRGTINSCNIGTSGLPDMYTRGPRVYISGKPRVSMLLLLCSTSHMG